MKNAREIRGISDLAEVNLADIFSRLPVKTLVQLKCVCKHWRTLTSTPSFISDADYILFDTGRTSGLIPMRNLSGLIDLNRPCGFGYTVVGSINGLVCLTSNDIYKPICLWNPSINQFKFLPLRTFKLPKSDCVGFGYEQNSDDYKVMRVINCYNGRQETKIEVYSTKSGSWRKLKNDVYVKVNRNCDAIVEGFTYWFIRNMDEPRKTVLASFDLRSEMFSIIPLPEALTTESYTLRAMNYHGSLALLARSSQYEFRKCLEVWVIEGRSGADGVWQKKFTVGMSFNISGHWGLTSGDIVVAEAPNMLFLVDLRTKQLREIGENRILSVFYYTESLVSIKGFQPVPSQ